MPKLMHNHRLMIWLLVACLLLPACGIFAASDLAPEPDEIVNEDIPAVQEQAWPTLEAGPQELPTPESGTTELLPVIIIEGAQAAECLSPEAQTMGSSIAANFETTYEQVMGWYCAGHEFEDILLALETADSVDVPPADLLSKLEQGQSWDEIWKEIGLLK
ncbi:MAG: hypothetical protein R6V73_13335 [Anaerolineales bacterium]